MKPSPRQRPLPQAQEAFADLAFPGKGIDVSTAYQLQRPGTTPTGSNVRAYEPGTNRARGGSRPGLSRYLPVTATGATNLIQELTLLVGVGYSPPGGAVQTSQSGRVVTLVAVSNGSVYVASPGGTTWTTAANNTTSSPPLNTSGVVLSTVINQQVYLLDGTHWCYYTPVTNSVETWVPSVGTLPVGPDGGAPRLACTWRGRLVVSGLLTDPQNWFMSAVSDPTNWDYAPLAVTPTQAIAGNNSPLGMIGDVVTAMIPYTDDVLVMGGDHTIWQFSGDPMGGGQIDLVSDSTGMAWGVPWCKAPDGTLFFVSNRTGIYAWTPGGGAPTRVSQPIEALLLPTNTGSNTIRLIWNDRFQGLHVFITPTGSVSAAGHFFWEAPRQQMGQYVSPGAWWQDVFANNYHNPLCCTVFDGNNPGDRVPLVGSWDGYVRAIDPTATTDDGTSVASAVVLGPLVTANLDELLVKDLQAVLGETSGTVSYAVYTGATAELALSSSPIATGTWGAGRNLSNHVRRAAHALWVKITASTPWAMEAVRVRLSGLGKVRRRGR